MLRNARGGVQRNGCPHGVHLIFRHVMRLKELSGGICAVDLEAFIRAREPPDEAEIGHIEQLPVEAQLPLTPLLSPEQVDAVKELSVELPNLRMGMEYAAEAGDAIAVGE